MEQQEIIRIGLIIIIGILILTLTFQGLWYDIYLMPKQAKVCNNLWGEVMIENQRAWIDIWEGNVNLTENDIYKIKVALNTIEKDIKNG
ncbi:MAG TPA: hypothetical protein VMZ91_14190 [Candidatus Paceibacterota bacterium]|nr:hypothetical protein [Candidatus Paceibacterota bacterium]